MIAPRARLAGLILAASTVSASARAEPPLTSPIQVVALLKRAPNGVAAAVKRVQAACRGRLRRPLRDHPALLGEVTRRARSGPLADRKAVLDTFRCFSEARFARVLKPLFSDAEPEMVAYAAEVAARTESADLVAPMLAALKTRKPTCLKAGLAATMVDACVWLTYAPGACLGSASKGQREAAGLAASEMAAAPYPKVREVAVETLAATGLATHAKDVAELIAREKGGAFEPPNDAALLKRFEARRRALAKAR